MVKENLSWDNVEQVRVRFILTLRFFMLCRSVDLERMYRTVSTVGPNPFILMQRKGARQPQWERVLMLPGYPQLCPWSLLKTYVRLTQGQAAKGTPLFRSLIPPFLPLKANSIGSLTRRALMKLGVNTAFWKPHSTRGAGVAFLKELGMSSEEVCEIGKWKNVSAFTSHYLRLDAHTKVANKISAVLVHNVSPLERAEPDLTCTTGKNDQGGNVREGGAQDNGETRFLAGELCNVFEFI